MSYKLGDRALVYFPQEESGHLWKLSRPWHGLYRVISIAEPDMTVINIYNPQHNPIKVRQSRVKPTAPQIYLLGPIGMAQGELDRDPLPSGQFDQIPARRTLDILLQTLSHRELTIPPIVKRAHSRYSLRSLKK